MRVLAEALESFRRWTEPRQQSDDHPPLACWVDSEPAPASEVELAVDAGRATPDAVALWAECRSARLCVDVGAPHWGLRLLSPAEALELTRQESAERPECYRADDLIIGEFLADQECLVLSPSESGDKSLLVALPLDDRNEWYSVASNLTQFLELYYKNFGDKWWEEQ